jgi:flagellar hook protein FlgE
MVNPILGTTALSGLRAAGQVLRNSAHQVANVNTSGFEAGSTSLSDQAPGVQANEEPGGRTAAKSVQPSSTSLAQEAVTQVGAQAMYNANLASIKTEDEVLGTLIDMNR